MPKEEHYEVSREDLLKELEKDLKSNKPLIGSVKRVRLSKPMSKTEFSRIRRSLKLTPVQLAEDLDHPLEKVKAYENGKLEVSGLVAKVMRLMNEYSDFKDRMLEQ